MEDIRSTSPTPKNTCKSIIESCRHVTTMCAQLPWESIYHKAAKIKLLNSHVSVSCFVARGEKSIKSRFKKKKQKIVANGPVEEHQKQPEVHVHLTCIFVYVNCMYA